MFDPRLLHESIIAHVLNFGHTQYRLLAFRKCMGYGGAIIRSVSPGCVKIISQTQNWTDSELPGAVIQLTGIPTRSMENMKWYSSSQVSTAKHVSYPQLTTTHSHIFGNHNVSIHVFSRVDMHKCPLKPLFWHPYLISLDPNWNGRFKKPPVQTATKPNLGD